MRRHRRHIANIAHVAKAVLRCAAHLRNAAHRASNLARTDRRLPQRSATPRSAAGPTKRQGSRRKSLRFGAAIRRRDYFLGKRSKFWAWASHGLAQLHLASACVLPRASAKASASANPARTVSPGKPPHRSVTRVRARRPRAATRQPPPSWGRFRYRHHRFQFFSGRTSLTISAS